MYIKNQILHKFFKHFSEALLFAFTRKSIKDLSNVSTSGEGIIQTS